jgi:protein CpxP
MAFSTRRLNTTAVAAALLAALALPALAQPAPADAAAPAVAQSAAPHAHKDRKEMQDRKEMRKQRGEHMQRRAADLKAKLQLTPEQEGAWTTFTDAMKPQQRGAQLDWKGMRDLTTPERIDRMRAMRAQRDAEMDRRGEAAKAFYAQLNPAQQKTFDVQSQRMDPRMHGGEHRGPAGHGGPGRHGKGQAPATPAAAPAAQ